MLLSLLRPFGDMTHIVKVNRESDVASNSGTELSLTGRQPETLGWSGTTPLPPG